MPASEARSEPQASGVTGPKIRVGIGIATFPFDAPRDLFAFAERCECLGVDSLWQTDRLHGEDAQLEALAALAALAGATSRMKFGMNAVVASLRDPLLLAKQCATIDFLSGGRLLPVFGAGVEHDPVWKATGRAPAERGRRADEALEIAQRLWRGEEVHFAGRFFRYAGARITPLPVQQPLPCWIGGSSPAAIRRTARLGTGWLAGLTPITTAPRSRAGSGSPTPRWPAVSRGPGRRPPAAPSPGSSRAPGRTSRPARPSWC